jgi:ankyrin repeat protein
MEAADTGDTAAVQQLLQTGADINAARSDGVTPLFMASLKGRADVVKLLLDKGANASAANLAGRVCKVVG